MILNTDKYKILQIRDKSTMNHLTFHTLSMTYCSCSQFIKLLADKN